jgi:hypothetical protein
MRQSQSIEMLAPALVAAQAEIGGAVKGSDNPFFKSKFADLNTVILALKPIFVKHGFAVIQMPVSDENGVGVSTRIQHNSGEFIEQQFTLPLAKNDPQAAGSAITYAKRYALKALGLMPDLDDDGEAAMFRQVDEFTAEQKAEYVSIMASADGWKMKQFGATVGNEVMTALFNAAPAGEKTKQKKLCNEIVTEANKELKASLAGIQEALENQSADSVVEILAECIEIEREFVIKGLTEVQHREIQNLGVEL